MSHYMDNETHIKVYLDLFMIKTIRDFTNNLISQNQLNSISLLYKNSYILSFEDIDYYCLKFTEIMKTALRL